MAGSNAVGRPTKLTPSTLTKLTAAFANGFNIEQACRYANIAVKTYYEWLKKNPEFSEEMDRAQNTLGMQARKVVANAINQGDLQAAFRWLERRDPEFSAKAEIINKTDPVEEILKEYKLDNGIPKTTTQSPPKE